MDASVVTFELVDKWINYSYFRELALPTSFHLLLPKKFLLLVGIVPVGLDLPCFFQSMLVVERSLEELLALHTGAGGDIVAIPTLSVQALSPRTIG